MLIKQVTQDFAIKVFNRSKIKQGSCHSTIFVPNSFLEDGDYHLPAMMMMMTVVMIVGLIFIIHEVLAGRKYFDIKQTSFVLFE